VSEALGADTVIDETEPNWLDRARQATGSSRPHVVFDGVGGVIGGAAFGVMAERGRFSAHGAPSGDVAAIDPKDAVRRGVTGRGTEQVQFAPDDTKRLTARVLAEAAAGRLRPVIGESYPLPQATEAHDAIDARSVIGKTLLLP
jgi:NADPH2:quinone reductase